MVLFVYVLLFDLLIRCSASSLYTVEVVASWKDTSLMLRNGTPPSLTLDQLFTFQITSDKPMYGFRCNSESNFNKIYLNSGLNLIGIDSAGNHNYILPNNVNAIADMNGTWQCTAYPPEGPNALVCQFNVKVTKPSSSIDLNKCRSNSCHELATCTDTDSGFQCSCPKGYMGDGITCTDINECESDSNESMACSIYAQCQNVPGNFICTCWVGYTGNAYNRQGCVDVNECDIPDVCRAVPGSTCVNYQSGYNCSCPIGSFLVDSYIGCTYSDACVSNPCGINSLCQSRNGIFHCTCQEGFQGNAATQCLPAAPVTDETPSTAEEIEAITNDRSRTAGLSEFSTATSPYINIWIYKRQGVFHHNTTSMLVLHKPFTIHVKSSEQFSRILCFKANHRTEIYVNEPLDRIGNEEYNYRAYYKMGAIVQMDYFWICLLQAYTLQIRLSFRPNFTNQVYFPVPADTQVPKKVTEVTTPRIKATTSTEEPQKPVSTTTISSYVNIKLIDDIQTPYKIDVNVSNILLGKPFVINVEKYKDFTFSHIKCHFAQNPNQVYVNDPFIEVNNLFTVMVNYATETMEERWNCTLNSSHGNISFLFLVKFITTGIASSVWVNDVNITVTAADKEKTGYDGRGEYWYREGELAKITCKKRNGTMSVAFHRHNNTTKLLPTWFTDVVEQTIYLKLTSEYQNDYIACNVKTKPFYPESLNTVRLYFYELPFNSDNDLPSFYVNGLILAPAKMHNNVNYVYEYYEREVLLIKGIMNSKNTCTCVSENVPDELKEISTGMNESFEITLILVQPYITDCIYSTRAFHLELKPARTYNFNPVISGLSFAQTQMKYQYDVQNNVIVYKNNGNRELNLSCSRVQSKACLWIKFNNDTNLEDGEIVGTNINKFTSYYRFVHEKNNLNSYVIKCKCRSFYNKYYTTLAEIINDIIEPEPIQYSKEEPSQATTPSTGDGNFSLLYMILIIGVTLIAVILVVCLIVGIHKRKRKREQAQASDINYESLDDGLMPPPRQWDNYSHPADIDDSYTYTVPHVAENIGKMPSGQQQPDSETLYAEVGGRGEPNYASVQLKDERELRNEYVNLKQQMPAYSQIQPKKLRGNKDCSPQVLPMSNEENYAQVLPKSLRNQAVASKYANLLENQRYANAQAKTDDYAEPAYCEVNLKK